jgi:hypothetical protein
VWIRFRPYELFWHTTHAFLVEDVRSIELEAIRHERRRRRGIGIGRRASRVVESAITRVSFEYGTTDHASIDLNETEAVVVAAFQDVLDRLVDDADATSASPLVTDRFELDRTNVLDQDGARTTRPE